jgi:hypothetical protein
MENLKSFALAIAVAAALMAFVGVGSASAAAGSLTCPAGTLCPTNTTLHAESEGKTVLDAPFGNVECNSTVEGHTTTSSEGGSAGKADGPITALNWSNCGSDTVTTLATGTLSVESTGGLTSTGAKVTVEHIGTHCIYETSGTTMGTLTSANAERNATPDISATIPRVGGRSGAFCGSSAPWTGSYKVTSPSGLGIDGEVPENVDLSLSAETFHAGDEKTLTEQNTGNVEWTVKEQHLVFHGGSWDSTANQDCTPGTRAPGTSCTRSLKCTTAGTMTWSVKVESTAGSIRERTITVTCDT